MCTVIRMNSMGGHHPFKLIYSRPKTIAQKLAAWDEVLLHFDWAENFEEYHVVKILHMLARCSIAM